MTDDNVFVLLNEYLAPYVLNKGVLKELFPQLAVILFEYLVHRASFDGFVRMLLVNAWEEDDEHFQHVLLVE